MKDEALRALQVVEKAPRSGHKQIDSFLELVGLLTSLGPSDHHTVRFPMILETVSGPLVVMHGQFPGRCYDQHTCPLLRGEVGLTKHLHGWNHVRQCLTTACLGGTKHVTSVQHVWDGPCLDFSCFREAKLGYSLLSLF